MNLPALYQIYLLVHQSICQGRSPNKKNRDLLMCLLFSSSDPGDNPVLRFGPNLGDHKENRRRILKKSPPCRMPRRKVRHGIGQRLLPEDTLPTKIDSARPRARPRLEGCCLRSAGRSSQGRARAPTSSLSMCYPASRHPSGTGALTLMAERSQWGVGLGGGRGSCPKGTDATTSPSRNMAPAVPEQQSLLKRHSSDRRRWMSPGLQSLLSTYASDCCYLGG